MCQAKRSAVKMRIWLGISGVGLSIWRYSWESESPELYRTVAPRLSAMLNAAFLIRLNSLRLLIFWTHEPITKENRMPMSILVSGGTLVFPDTTRYRVNGR
jgi:hypothetical protein